MDEALEASRMSRAGWSITRIRLAVDETYGR